MKRITLIATLCILWMNASAKEINFVKGNTTWSAIKEKAKKENKMIFFDAYASWCGPCKYMERSVYTNDTVAAFYNANFINVKMDMEDGEGPDLSTEFGITAYPTLLFFSPDGKIVHKKVGAIDAAAFTELGKKAKDPNQQYYPLKQKAQSLSLSDELFEKWVAMANEMDDEDRRPIIYRYIHKNETAIAKNKYVTNIALTLADSLSETQLAKLYSLKDDIKALQKWDDEELKSALFRQSFLTAIYAYMAHNESMQAFDAVMKKYEPQRIRYAQQEIKLRLAHEDNTEVAKLLNESITLYATEISLKDLSNLFFTHLDALDEEGYSQLEKSLSSYKIAADDVNNQYLYRFMQVICNIKIGNTESAKTYGRMVYNDSKAPADLRKSISEEFGFE